MKQLILDIVRPSSDEESAGDNVHHASEYHVQYERRREPNLNHARFHEALESADFFSSDVAIFDHMFTLLDRTGDEVIFAHEFLIGVCALLRGDLATKLQGPFVRSQPSMASIYCLWRAWICSWLVSCCCT